GRRAAATPPAAPPRRGGTARPGRSAAGRLPGPPGRDAAAGAGGGLRRHVRPSQAVLPLPDLLRLRRHPETGNGPAALQTGVPGGGARPGRRRAAGPPGGRPGVRRDGGSRTGTAAAARAPRGPGAAASRARRVTVTVGAGPGGGLGDVAAADRTQRGGRRPPR